MNNKVSFLKKSFQQKETLCPLLFSNNKLKPVVRKKLLEIAEDFLDSFDVPNIVPVDIILGGSLANYHWSVYSDVDLHLVFNANDINKDKKLVEDYLLSKKSEWNLKYDVKIYGFDVEVYGQITPELTSAGIYSILNNKWVSTPQKEDYEVPIEKIVKKTKVFTKIFDDIINLKDDEKTKLGFIERIMEKVRNYRTKGLETGGEFSEENMVFKTLRRTGYLEKIKEYKKELKNRSLSL
jgi:hypothetical protein